MLGSSATEISETIRARMFGLSNQVLGPPAPTLTSTNVYYGKTRLAATFFNIFKDFNDNLLLLSIPIYMPKRISIPFH